jgi:dephospho-CoA kinase
MTASMSGIYTASVSDPPARPIGSYERRAVSFEPWDPRTTIVAERVIALIGACRPDLHVEHIGSTAVPGLPGKGIVDLGTEADAAEIPAITEAMYELGFGPEPGPDPWPPSRPMHVGSFDLDGVEFRVHFHVHPLGGDLPRDVRFRDALRADPALAAGYARIKSGILEGSEGPVDRIVYQDTKGDWIIDTYDRLGIPRPVAVRGAVKEESL